MSIGNPLRNNGRPDGAAILCSPPAGLFRRVPAAGAEGSGKKDRLSSGFRQLPRARNSGSLNRSGATWQSAPPSLRTQRSVHALRSPQGVSPLPACRAGSLLLQSGVSSPPLTCRATWGTIMSADSTAFMEFSHGCHADSHRIAPALPWKAQGFGQFRLTILHLNNAYEP